MLAPKAFYDQLTAHLEEIGYTRSANDRCLFHRRFENGRQIMSCIHVDDFAVAASDNSLIDDLAGHRSEAQVYHQGERVP